MKKFITQLRTYHADATSSEVFLPNEPTRFCYALEDVARPVNVKFPGETCIPEGVYRCTPTFSNRFQKELLQLYNVPEGMLVRKDGIEFTGARIHGGNTIEDTLGCPLYAFNFNEADLTIWKRASDKLLEWVKAEEAAGNEIYVIICSE